MIQYLWHNKEVPSDMKVYQVSGILLNDRTEVLLYEENGRYRIPGGHPIENENMEDTLIRECFEEVNASIDNITYLGYQEVIGDKKEPYAQVRYIAKIKKLGKNREDIDNGKLYRRLFVPLDEVNSFLNWDDVGRKMIQTVKEKIGIN